MRICAETMSAMAFLPTNRTHGVAADTRHPFDTEIESLNTVSQSSAIQERHEEGPEAAIDMQADVMPVRQCAESGDGVLKWLQSAFAWLWMGGGARSCHQDS